MSWLYEQWAGYPPAMDPDIEQVIARPAPTSVTIIGRVRYHHWRCDTCDVRWAAPADEPAECWCCGDTDLPTHRLLGPDLASAYTHNHHREAS